jgi:hypothetical protein
MALKQTLDLAAKGISLAISFSSKSVMPWEILRFGFVNASADLFNESLYIIKITALHIYIF